MTLKDLPKWLWLGMPMLITGIPFVFRWIGPRTESYLYGELGIIENLTFLFLVVAVVAGGRILLHGSLKSYALAKSWVFLITLECIYFAGEEVSWGQHFFQWQTPTTWSEINDQQETNLHNTSAIFDQLPRALLSVAALVGGVIVPLFFLLSKKKLLLGPLYYWLWPTLVCLPSALLSALVSWHEKSYSLLNMETPTLLDIRSGETKEWLLASFLMLYLLSLFVRLKQVQKSNAN